MWQPTEQKEEMNKKEEGQTKLPTITSKFTRRMLTKYEKNTKYIVGFRVYGCKQPGTIRPTYESYET